MYHYPHLKKDLYADLTQWKDGLIDKLDSLTKYEENDLRPIRTIIKTKILNIYHDLIEKKTEYKVIKEKLDDARETHAGLELMIKRLEETAEKYKRDLEKAKCNVLYTPAEQREVINKYWKIQNNLKKETRKVEKKQEELIIKQEELVQAISDTELATSSYYRLSDKERILFEEDRPLILKAIEKHGNLATAIKSDKKIKSTLSAVMYYAEKHPAFKTDLEIAKKIFKENLDATVLDRALEGTENPVFQRGEYIGDYKIKDNKLLMEVAKANIPEKYDRKAYAAENPPNTTNNTINIINYENVDETKHGYTRDIGMVTDVDDSGRVKRIMQQDKLIANAQKQENVEVYIPEVIENEIKEDK